MFTVLVVYGLIRVISKGAKKHMRFKRFLIKMGVKGRRGKIAEDRLLENCHNNGIGV